MKESVADIQHNARWMRAMRDHLGWSTAQAAEAIKATAKALDDKVELSQQTVSAFENGKHKSNPRWLGYAQIAVAQEARRRHLHEGEVWELRLPASSGKFFASQRDRAGVNNPWDEFDPGPDPRPQVDRESPQEQALLDHFRALSAKDRAALFQLAQSLASSANSPTVHAKQHGYRGE